MGHEDHHGHHNPHHRHQQQQQQQQQQSLSAAYSGADPSFLVSAISSAADALGAGGSLNGKGATATAALQAVLLGRGGGGADAGGGAVVADDGPDVDALYAMVELPDEEAILRAFGGSEVVGCVDGAAAATAARETDTERRGEPRPTSTSGRSSGSGHVSPSSGRPTGVSVVVASASSDGVSEVAVASATATATATATSAVAVASDDGRTSAMSNGSTAATVGGSRLVRCLHPLASSERLERLCHVLHPWCAGPSLSRTMMEHIGTMLDQEIVSSVLEEVLGRAFDLYWQRFVQKEVLSFSVCASLTDLKATLDGVYLAADAPPVEVTRDGRRRQRQQFDSEVSALRRREHLRWVWVKGVPVSSSGVPIDRGASSTSEVAAGYALPHGVEDDGASQLLLPEDGGTPPGPCLGLLPDDEPALAVIDSGARGAVPIRSIVDRPSNGSACSSRGGPSVSGASRATRSSRLSSGNVIPGESDSTRGHQGHRSSLTGTSGMTIGGSGQRGGGGTPTGASGSGAHGIPAPGSESAAASGRGSGAGGVVSAPDSEEDSDGMGPSDLRRATSVMSREYRRAAGGSGGGAKRGSVVDETMVRSAGDEGDGDGSGGAHDRDGSISITRVRSSLSGNAANVSTGATGRSGSWRRRARASDRPGWGVSSPQNADRAGGLASPTGSAGSEESRHARDGVPGGRGEGASESRRRGRSGAGSGGAGRRRSRRGSSSLGDGYEAGDAGDVVGGTYTGTGAMGSARAQRVGLVHSLARERKRIGRVVGAPTLGGSTGGSGAGHGGQVGESGASGEDHAQHGSSAGSGRRKSAGHHAPRRGRHGHGDAPGGSRGMLSATATGGGAGGGASGGAGSSGGGAHGHRDAASAISYGIMPRHVVDADSGRGPVVVIPHAAEATALPPARRPLRVAVHRCGPTAAAAGCGGAANRRGRSGGAADGGPAGADHRKRIRGRGAVDGTAAGSAGGAGEGTIGGTTGADGTRSVLVDDPTAGDRGGAGSGGGGGAPVRVRARAPSRSHCSTASLPCGSSLVCSRVSHSRRG